MERSSILILLASCQQICMTYTTAVCIVNKTPDDGRRDCPKHVEFHSKNKSEKLVYLVGFVIRKLFLLKLSATLCCDIGKGKYCIPGGDRVPDTWSCV